MSTDDRIRTEEELEHAVALETAREIARMAATIRALWAGLERLAEGKAHGPSVTYWNIARRLRAGETIEEILAAPRLEGEVFGPCPARQEPGPWRADEEDRWISSAWTREGSRWSLEWFPRTCSFCGSVHPEDACRLLEAGWEVERTRKPWKVYLHPPGYTHAMREALGAIRERGVEALPETWSPVPPVKLYGYHTTPELREQMAEAERRTR